jgi:ubiquinone/menaquinone biosynthesis C-methylase UbiE
MNKLSKRIWLLDRKYRKNYGMASWNFNNAEKHIIRYQKAANYCVDKIVLDAACGIGYGSFILSCVAKQVYACDYKEEIEFAKKHFSKPNISFIQSDVMNMPYEDNFFDVVVACEIIEHLKDVEKFLSECYRVLKQEGILYITSPNAEGFKLENLEKKWKTRYNHFREFTVTELSTLLTSLFRIKKTFVQYKPRKHNKMRYPEFLNNYLKFNWIANRIYRIHSIDNINGRDLSRYQTQIHIARKTGEK